MLSFLRGLRMNHLNKENIGKYIIYALGEIVLITLGVLIAVNINKVVVEKNNAIVRCQYLEELKYTLDLDMEEVKEIISVTAERNISIKKLILAIENDSWSELDSIENRINAVRKFVFLTQRTKTKMEELKYSNIDLIGNRELKNKLLLYQDEQIGDLINIERRYNYVDDKIRDFYSENLYGGQQKIDDLKKDKLFYSLIRQKYGENDRMKNNYENISKKQINIKNLLDEEIRKNCNS